MNSTIASAIIMLATSHRLRATVSIWSANVSPSTPIGIVPRMTNQPIRASGSPRTAGLTSDRVQAEMIRQMSWRK